MYVTQGDNMTDQEKKQTLILNSQGLGYRAIATKLSVSSSSVKSYLKSKAVQKMNFVPPKRPDGITCPVCDAPLEQPKTGRRRYFCSGKCRSHYWTAYNAGSIKYKCPQCGKSFNTTHSNRKFCSLECYFDHRFNRKEKNASIK